MFNDYFNKDLSKYINIQINKLIRVNIHMHMCDITFKLYDL